MLVAKLAEAFTAIGNDTKALVARSLPEGGQPGQMLAKAADGTSAWVNAPTGGSGGGLTTEQEQNLKVLTAYGRTQGVFTQAAPDLTVQHATPTSTDVSITCSPQGWQAGMDGHTWSIAWGDGQVQTVTSSGTLAASHIYEQPGSYTINVRWTSALGMQSEAAPKQVNIVAAATGNAPTAWTFTTTYPTSSSFVHPPTQATLSDGVVTDDTSYAAGMMTSYNGDTNEFTSESSVTADFGTKCVLSSVAITPPTEQFLSDIISGSYPSMNGQKLSYSVDGTVWHTFAVMENVTDGSQRVYQVGGVEARYVKLDGTSLGRTVVGDIQFFGPEASTQPDMGTWTFVHTNNVAGLPAPTQATLSGNVIDAATSFGCTGNTSYVRADFGEVRTINSVKLAAAHPDTPGGWTINDCNGASIQYSMDGTTWTRIAYAANHVAGETAPREYAAGGVQARHVRISKPTRVAVGHISFT